MLFVVSYVCGKANGSPAGFRGLHEFANGFEDADDLHIMLRQLCLQTVQFPGQVFMCGKNLRRRTKARMMMMFTWIARSLLSTLESMATPCSVKA